MNKYENLIAYQKAFKLAMEIFRISKSFPFEERYSLTDQVRRSSRSVCANIGESTRRTEHLKYFLAKLYDAQCENTETKIWLEFARECGYLEETDLLRLSILNDEVSRLLHHMISNPLKFL